MIKKITVCIQLQKLLRITRMLEKEWLIGFRGFSLSWFTFLSLYMFVVMVGYIG